MFFATPGFLTPTQTPAATYLLDIYSGAAAAYSVRKLSSTTTNSMRVRRSSDNSEQDIGFVGSDLDTASLLSFVGANDGFVTTWYDQSGNGYNATQATAGNQPQIVSSGAVITDNGKPAIDWGTVGNSKSLFNLAVDISHKSSFSVINYDGTNPFTQYYGVLTYNYTANEDLSILTNNASTTWYIGLHGHNGGVPTNTALPTILNQTLLFDAINSAPNRTNIYIGIDRALASRGWQGKIQEVIIYNTDQTANRTAIESNINTYFEVY